MAHAVRITAANGVDVVELTHFTDYQQAVDGYFQVVPLGPTHALIVNEEGKLQGLPENTTATTLAQEYNALLADDRIAGTALIVGVSGSEYTDASPAMLQRAHRAAVRR